MRWGVAVSAALHAGTLCAVGAAWEPPARGARELRVPVMVTSGPPGGLYQPGRQASPPAVERGGAGGAQGGPEEATARAPRAERGGRGIGERDA